MSEETISSSLDVSDLDNMLRAVKHAHTRGAYTMEEVSQLFPVVQRVEAWLSAYKSQIDAPTSEAEPKADEPVSEPVVEESKKKKEKAKAKK